MANWFIGLPVSPAHWFARVGEPPRKVRLFHPDDLHVTVAFLGPVREAAARDAFAHAGTWPVGAVEVALGPVGPMGNPRRPSALSAHLTLGHEAVAAGIGGVRDAMCDAASVARDIRPALPHVTLARPSRKAAHPELRAALLWAAQLDLGTPRVRLEHMALYTWAPDRQERLFQVVQVQPLA